MELGCKYFFIIFEEEFIYFKMIPIGPPPDIYWSPPYHILKKFSVILYSFHISMSSLHLQFCIMNILTSEKVQQCEFWLLVIILGLYECNAINNICVYMGMCIILKC